MELRKNRTPRILVSFLTALAFAFGALAAPVSATGVDLASVTPTVDIHVNLGTTTVTDTFLSALRDKLVALGIDADKVKLTLTNTDSVDAGDVSQWDVYDHFGDWEERAASIYDTYLDADGVEHYYNWDTDHFYYPNLDPGEPGFSDDPHILPSADGGTLYFYGYGEPAFIDFLLSKTDTAADKKILYTLDENSATYHSLYGSGFLFNTAIDAGKGTLSGYALLVTEDNIQLLGIDGVDVDTFHDNESIGDITDLSGVSVLAYFKKPDTRVHNFIVDISGDKVSIRDNGEYLQSEPQNPISDAFFKSFWNGLKTGKSYDSFWWSTTDKTFRVSGFSSTTVAVTAEEFAAAGNDLYSALILKGYYSPRYNVYDGYANGDYSVVVDDYDCYPCYLVDVGTSLESYDDAAAYLTTKGITDYDQIVNYWWAEGIGQYVISVKDEKYSIKVPVMDDIVAAYAAENVDISDYQYSYLNEAGDAVVWEYLVDGNYQSIEIPLIDIVGHTALTSEDYNLPETYGNRFGPMCSYSSHGCEDLTSVTFSNLSMNVVSSQVVSLSETATAQTYLAGARSFFLNAEDSVISGLDVPALGKIFFDGGVAFIGLASVTSKTQEAAIATAAGTGTTILASDDDYVDQVATYIYEIVKADIIANLLATYPVDAVASYDAGDVAVDGLSSSVDILSDLLAGLTVSLKLDVSTTILEDVPEADRTLVDEYLNGLPAEQNQGHLLLDISLIKTLIDDSGSSENPVTETLKPLKITIVLPESAWGFPSYKVFRIHDGTTEELKTTYDSEAHSLTFWTDKFSTYGVTFGSDNPQTGDASRDSWLLAVFGLGILMLLVTVSRSKRRMGN